VAIKQVKVDVNDLTLGMFVSSLDRPWAQTPFPIQGMLIKTTKDISGLRAYCDHVFINITKGKSPIEEPEKVETKPKKKPELAPSETHRATKPKDNKEILEVPPIQVRRNVYTETIPLSKESAKAEHVLTELRGNLTLAVKQIARDKPIDYKSLNESVNGMVESVLRCPDAFSWMLRLRQKDHHTHDHSLRAALWAVQFGRYIGLPKDEINVLCMGALMKDIGKVRISNAILRKKHRTVEEQEEYEKFIEYGMDMLRQTDGIEPRIISVVHFHCEYHNGTGFPQGIAGARIPLLARIAGIASTFDALSNPRESTETVAPSRAVSLLYNMRNKQFQEDIVVQFIQSVGLYPTGTLVELSTGDIGVVVEQDPKSRLTPRVAVLKKTTGSPLMVDECVVIDLRDEDDARNKLKNQGISRAETIAKLTIVRDLEASSYDVDLTNISTTFLVDEAAKSNPTFRTLRERLFKKSS